MTEDERSQEVHHRNADDTDRAWVERVRDAYEPDPMTPAQRAAFDARLADRIERARRRGWVIAMAGPVLLAAAATLVWIALGPAPDPGTREPVVAENAPANRPESLRAWQQEVISAANPEAASPSDRRAADLPAEYQALDSLFLAGANGGAHAR